MSWIGSARFTGRSETDLMVAFWRSLRVATCFLVPFSGRCLGLGAATIEAMVTGISVIANVPLDSVVKTELRDLEDIVHLDGLVPGVIAQKERKLLDDDPSREKVGRGGREFLRRHLNWNRVGQDMEALLVSVVQTRRKDAAW